MLWNSGGGVTAKTCSAGDFFTAVDGSGNFTCSTASGSGDVTAVGDCASGACFDGTSGNSIQFEARPRTRSRRRWRRPTRPLTVRSRCPTAPGRWRSKRPSTSRLRGMRRDERGNGHQAGDHCSLRARPRRYALRAGRHLCLWLDADTLPGLAIDTRTRPNALRPHGAAARTVILGDGHGDRRAVPLWCAPSGLLLRATSACSPGPLVDAGAARAISTLSAG